MLEKILMVILVFWLLWTYRYVGLLLYKIRHADSEEGRSRPSFPRGSNLFWFVVANIIKKFRPYWLSRWSFLRLHLWDFSKSYHQGLFKPWYHFIAVEYKEIYLWPWFEISPYVIREIKCWRRIWWFDERINLRRSDWRILSDEVERDLKSFRVIGVREDKARGIYQILLKLPGRATEVLGSCEKGVFSKFQEKAGGKDLRISLESHLFSEKKQARTDKVMVVVHHQSNIIYKVQFCGPEWRRNFINFFREVA